MNNDRIAQGNKRKLAHLIIRDVFSVTERVLRTVTDELIAENNYTGVMSALTAIHNARLNVYSQATPDTVARIVLRQYNIAMWAVKQFGSGGAVNTQDH